METVADFIVLGTKLTAEGDCSHKIKRRVLLGRKKNFDQPRQHNKKQRHDCANKGPSSQGYGFSSGHVWMTHSSTVAWKIQWMEGTGRLQSMWSLGVEHD